MSKATLCKKYYTVKMALANPSWLYIFGDNVAGFGKKGQAIIRDCPNAFGIPTKFKPYNDSSSFFNDDDLQCVYHIDSTLDNLERVSKNWSTIVLPHDGLGTGLARLPEKAPKLCIYLHHMLEEMFNIDYSHVICKL